MDYVLNFFSNFAATIASNPAWAHDATIIQGWVSVLSKLPH